jgi:hypothetical protein
VGILFDGAHAGEFHRRLRHVAHHHREVRAEVGVLKVIADDAEDLLRDESLVLRLVQELHPFVLLSELDEVGRAQWEVVHLAELGYEPPRTVHASV